MQDPGVDAENVLSGELSATKQRFAFSVHTQNPPSSSPSMLPSPPLIKRDRGERRQNNVSQGDPCSAEAGHRHRIPSDALSQTVSAVKLSLPNVSIGRSTVSEVPGQCRGFV